MKNYLESTSHIVSCQLKVALNIKFIIRDKILERSHGRVERAFECYSEDLHSGPLPSLISYPATLVTSSPQACNFVNKMMFPPPEALPHIIVSWKP